MQYDFLTFKVITVILELSLSVLLRNSINYWITRLFPIIRRAIKWSNLYFLSSMSWSKNVPSNVRILHNPQSSSIACWRLRDREISQLKWHANDQQTTPGNAGEDSVSRCQDDIDSNKILLPLCPTNCYASDCVSLLLTWLSLVLRPTVPVCDKLHELYPELQSHPTRPTVWN